LRQPGLPGTAESWEWIVVEHQVPFDGDVVAGGALAEGEHTVPMTVRDADGNLLATLGDVVVDVTRTPEGWVWDARIPGEVAPDLAEHLSAGRFAFKIRWTQRAVGPPPGGIPFGPVRDLGSSPLERRLDEDDADAS